MSIVSFSFHHHLQPCRVEGIKAVKDFLGVLNREVIEGAVLAFHEDFGIILQRGCSFLKLVDKLVDVHCRLVLGVAPLKIKFKIDI